MDLEGTPVLAGRLWTRAQRGRESASFEYDQDWLRRADHFALEPALSLGPGPHHTAPGKALFGALGDSAPNRWGRLLMRRAERQQARDEGRTPRTLLELDYLLLVDDEARQGALRFQERADGPFLAPYEGSRIPPLLALPRLLGASERVEVDEEDAADLRLLLAPGSSLGGARPKASIRDQDGCLALAKFPARTDETNVVLWEAVALTMAYRCGIAVPEWRLQEVAGRKVLLSRRFDRLEDVRVPFLSAMSMLGASDRETRSYLEIADALHAHGARATEDMRALWKRIVFSVLISNTDDHLRNHGFLHASGGWRLAPAYDLNPVPQDIKPRVLSTAIDEEDPTASLELTMKVADYFRVERDDARRLARETGEQVKRWREVARTVGVGATEIERMASAFEHEDLAAALKAI